jgi:hypothetical protein
MMMSSIVELRHHRREREGGEPMRRGVLRVEEIDQTQAALAGGMGEPSRIAGIRVPAIRDGQRMRVPATGGYIEIQPSSVPRSGRRLPGDRVTLHR